MWTLEIASILPSHKDLKYELHEDPGFVLVIVHEEVVDLVEVVHHQQECDRFLFAEIQKSTQFLDTSPIRIGLKFVFLNLGSNVREDLLFFRRSRRILILSFSISRLDFRF